MVQIYPNYYIMCKSFRATLARQSLVIFGLLGHLLHQLGESIDRIMSHRRNVQGGTEVCDITGRSHNGGITDISHAKKGMASEYISKV